MHDPPGDAGDDHGHLTSLTPSSADVSRAIGLWRAGAGARVWRPGLRHIAFNVDDVRGVVDRVREAGWDTIGDIVDYRNMFLLRYVRGPDGLIVELAGRLDGAPG